MHRFLILSILCAVKAEAAPWSCKYDQIDAITNLEGYDFISRRQKPGIRCNLRAESTLMNATQLTDLVEFKWPARAPPTILNRSLYLPSVLGRFNLTPRVTTVKLLNLK